MMRRALRAFTLLEVLVSLAILLGGVVMIIWLFPKNLEASNEAELLSSAALLASMKANEILRDDDAATSGSLVTAISQMDTPSPPIEFPMEPRLAYSFSGETLLYVNSGNAAQTQPDVARVIVRYSPNYRQSNDILYEYRFGQ